MILNEVYLLSRVNIQHQGNPYCWTSTRLVSLRHSVCAQPHRKEFPRQCSVLLLHLTSPIFLLPLHLCHPLSHESPTHASILNILYELHQLHHLLALENLSQSDTYFRTRKYVPWRIRLPPQIISYMEVGCILSREERTIPVSPGEDYAIENRGKNTSRYFNIKRPEATVPEGASQYIFFTLGGNRQSFPGKPMHLYHY